jgi:hypothetical protein
MNRDEIRAVYEAGPDAVIALVERLLAIVADQQTALTQLTARVAEVQPGAPSQVSVKVKGIAPRR